MNVQEIAGQMQNNTNETNLLNFIDRFDQNVQVCVCARVVTFAKPVMHVEKAITSGALFATLHTCAASNIKS